MTDSNPSFTQLALSNKLLYSEGNVQVFGLVGQTTFHVENATAFVFVQHGMVTYNSTWPMRSKQYGCFADGWLVSSYDAIAMLVLVTSGYRGMCMVGGELEVQGRLQYIDGCTDSLLIPPVKMGDPCLNHLHFPAGVEQSAHTHPDIRVGMITRGRGECVTPWGNTQLYPGVLFIIHPLGAEKLVGLDGNEHFVGVHSFRTTDSSMDVVAFHPTSDYGPTDEQHPMILQTDLVNA